MKILQVGPIPPEIGGISKGGVATHLWELSYKLASNKHEVAIIASNYDPNLSSPVIKNGVKIYGISKLNLYKFLIFCIKSLNIEMLKSFYNIMNYHENFRRPSTFLKLFFYRYVIEDFRPDIIHVHHLEERFPLVYYSLSNKRIPIISTIHSFHSVEFTDPAISRRNYNLIKKNLKLCKGLILVSNHIKENLESLFGSYTGSQWIINNPIDSKKYYLISKRDARKKINFPDDNLPLLLFVGNLNRRKGEFLIIDAIKSLKEEIKLKVIIIGDGSEFENLRDYVYRSGTSNIVELRGAKYYPDLLYYYNSADIFVMPSYSEGFALSYLEALSCGIPIIGIMGVADELITDENYGILVEPGNSDSLARAIKAALSRDWDREIIRKYAERFSWDIKICEFERVYNSMLTKY